MSEVTFSEQEIRDSYYVMRAMHDGACPECGHTGEPDMFVAGSALRCPECNFVIIGAELEGIRRSTRKTMLRRVASFAGCRKRLAEFGNMPAYVDDDKHA